ncbi:hypothetical protein Moror_1405 [Moniliophthora roreri MCA 2997]|uniref:Uncharacterized protein n=2 Tax=Moniliophthora roreri TaxID=221103 RepID=V2XJ13_MONRO|nr:hypothetical protein Moror_1405 [Moniliophthora roreri MCA 2997]
MKIGSYLGVVNVNHLDKSVFAFQFSVAEDLDVKAEGMNWLQQTYPGYEFHYITFTDSHNVKIPILKTHDYIWNQDDTCEKDELASQRK